MSLVIHAQVINLEVDSHVIALLELLAHAGAQLGGPDDKLSFADVLGRNLFQLVGDDQAGG